jgi:hydrogenase expression/formation protein HypC
MCLAVPGKLLSISGDQPLMRTGQVSFGGIVKEVNLAYTPEARIGDYVIVHVGFAISTLDESEAHQVFEYLRQMDELGELQEETSSPVGRGSVRAVVPLGVASNALPGSTNSLS